LVLFGGGIWVGHLDAAGRVVITVCMRNFTGAPPNGKEEVVL